jgi:SOS-response transcriptional repressor LexA
MLGFRPRAAPLPRSEGGSVAERAAPRPHSCHGGDLTVSECSHLEPYALQVLGDSMAPEFPDQCIVIIEPIDQVRSGAYVFAEVENVRWFRQYVKDADGREWLIALNDLYPEIDLSGLAWRILGVITQRNVNRKIKHYDNF